MKPENWVAFLFASLGLFFIQKAIRNNAVRSWGWGRTGDAAPLSRVSYTLWGAMFILIGIIISRGPQLNILWVTVFFAFFIALGVSGFIDTRKARKRQLSHQ